MPVTISSRLQLQPDSRLLAFLPEQRELQHPLQLLHKLLDPGLPGAAQPPGPAGRQSGQLSMQVPGAWAPESWCPAPPVCGAAGCRDG